MGEESSSSPPRWSDLTALSEMVRPIMEARQFDESWGKRVLGPGVEYHPFQGGHVVVTQAGWELLADEMTSATGRPPAVSGFTGIAIYRDKCPCRVVTPPA